MIRLISKRLLHTRPTASTGTGGHFFSTSSLKPTLDGSNSTDQQSATVSYLVNSCGLSLESAISTSKNFQIGTTDQPDSVLTLLKSVGLSQSHIKKMITKRPIILLADANKTLKPNTDLFCSLGFSGTDLVKLLNKYPRILEANAHTTVEFFRANGFTEEQITTLTMKRPPLYFFNAPKTLKPKLEYFKSLGLSGADVSQILSCEPYILGRSLQNQIIPTVRVIRRVVGSNENVLGVIKACGSILERDLEEILEPNIAILINHGVPESLVLNFIMFHPRPLFLKTHRFSEVVEEVEKLGFDPTSLLYLFAIRSLGMMSKSLWQRKLGVYGSFGMTQDQVLSGFKRQPMFMLTSEKKIRKVMGFLVNELKLSPLIISKTPDLLLFSFEKRIVPRCSVLQLLMSKGVIKGNFGLVHAIKMPHKNFEAKYVSKYEIVIPEVVEAHQGKIQFQGFPIELKA